MTTIQAYQLKLEIIKLILENKSCDEQLKSLAGHYHIKLNKGPQIQKNKALLMFLDFNLDMEKRINAIYNIN